MPLSTFLCIDLTSSWYSPLTCRQSLKNFLTSQIVKFRAPSLERTFHYIVLMLDVISSAFKAEYSDHGTTRLAVFQVVGCCNFGDKKDLLRFTFLSRQSPEVLSNIR